MYRGESDIGGSESEVIVKEVVVNVEGDRDVGAAKVRWR